MPHNSFMPFADERRRFVLICAWSALIGLLLLSGGVSAAAAGVFPGAPIVQRIGPQDYRATPLLWSVAAAPGRLYVASADGVLVHDGADWDTVPLPGGRDATLVRHLPDGTLMAGGFDTWGRLEYDPIEGHRYVDLLAESGLGEAERAIGPVWEIVQTPQGVFVQSQKALHLWPADGGRLQSWPMPPEMRTLMALGGQLFARHQGRGFGVLRDGELQLIPGGETFAELPVAALLAWGGSRYLVAADGVWRMDDGRVQRVLVWPQQELAVYVVEPLEGGGFVLGTEDGEILHVDAGLRLRQFLKVSEQMIADLTHDAEGRLWAVTDTEVLRIDLPSPWSLIGHNQGLRGLVADSAEFDGALWVAATRGLQRLRADGSGGVLAERLPWVPHEAHALLADERGLLVGEREGLLWLRHGQAAPKRLHQGESVTHLLAARDAPDRVWAVAEEQLLGLRHGPDGWRVEQRWPFEGMAPLRVLELQAGELWFSDDRGAPQRWRIDPNDGRLDRQAFGPERGLPIDGSEQPKLHHIDGQLKAWSKGRLYRLDDAGQAFSAIEAPAWMQALLKPEHLTVVETPKGLFAVTPRDLLLRRPSATDWERVQVAGGSSSSFGLPRVGAGGVLRVPVWNGLLQYDPAHPDAPLPPLAVGFERLQVRVEGGEWQPAEPLHGVLALRSDQMLRMRFGLRSLEPGASYRYRLSGVVDEFTEWADRDLSIRSLEPGDYTFEVEGRLPSGRTVAPLRLQLRVLPDWHQRTALRLLALGLLVLAVIGAARWMVRRRVLRFAALNRLLEQRVAERTEALEQANARLSAMTVLDALTGVNNRRAFDLALAREWARGMESRRPLAALMVDVDHFKRFNDTHGHLEGDRVLIELGVVLGEGLQPPREMLARYGGEEFVLLLPGLGLEQAVQRAERLRRGVERSPLGVTVSIGVAVLVPEAGEDPARLIREADMALYEAKRRGRNRVVQAGA